jgi:Na+-transporting methylmalonyl-CoA/oxaloacetate decarboxylase gamma subunit
MNDILIALEIMWKGMAGIFAVALIIMAVVWLLGKIGKK